MTGDVPPPPSPKTTTHDDSRLGHYCIESTKHGMATSTPAPTASSAETWVWNATLGVYYHAPSQTYALPNATGEWAYLSPEELAARGANIGPSSSSAAATAPSFAPLGSTEMEEGEVEDDVGWGGLMDPDKLAHVVATTTTNSTSASSRRWTDREWDRDRDRDRERGRAPTLGNGHDPYGRMDAANPVPSSSPSPTPIPGHILRLVVRRSKALPHGAIALLDARPGGIQIGRDRGVKGDIARLRVREMEVSKTHAVVYWGREGRVDAAVRRPHAAVCHGEGKNSQDLGEVEGDGPDLQQRDSMLDGDLGGYHSNRDGRTESEEASDIGPDAEGWWIVDLGSTLGTYVAHRGEREATRLSEAKHSSTPFPIHHLSRVTVGTTTFVAHVHQDWPCGECQLAGSEEIRLDGGGAPESEGTATPGAAASPAQASSVSSQFDPPVGAAQRRGQRQFKRKLALDALRDTLLGNEPGPASSPGLAGPASTGGANATKIARGGGGYLDRSAQRRRLHPASPPRISSDRRGASTTGGNPTITAPAQPAGPSAASRIMLARQGWTPGAGLGRDASGRAEPVLAVLRNERVGLGARGQLADADDAAGVGDWRERGRQRRWNEAAQR